MSLLSDEWESLLNRASCGLVCYVQQLLGLLFIESEGRATCDAFVQLLPAFARVLFAEMEFGW